MRGFYWLSLALGIAAVNGAAIEGQHESEPKSKKLCRAKSSKSYTTRSHTQSIVPVSRSSSPSVSHSKPVSKPSSAGKPSSSSAPSSKPSSSGKPSSYSSPASSKPVSSSQPSHTPCINSPTNRQCWGKYDIDTNYYTTTPDTGVTREVQSHRKSLILVLVDH
jgi:hypothetical protein